MNVYVKDIFRNALSKIGVREVGQEPTVDQYNTCLFNANLMIDAWSVHRLMLRGNTTSPFSLTANKSSYTIGPSGCDFTAGKPVNLVQAFIRDSANLDYPVEIVTQEEYDSYPDKAIGTGRPERLWYDPGLSQQTAPNKGTIYLYPIPDSGPYTLYLVSEGYLTELVNLTDLITFEPAYYEALVYNLAVRVFQDFYGEKKDPPKSVIAFAKSSKRTIEQLNSRAVIGKVDVPGTKGGTYNVYSDSYA